MNAGLTSLDVLLLTDTLPNCAVAIAELSFDTGLSVRLHDGTTFTIEPRDLPGTGTRRRPGGPSTRRASPGRSARRHSIGQWGSWPGPIAPRPGFRHALGMFEALSKYIDLLKASGWQTGATPLAAGLFLYLSHAGILPPLEPWMLLARWVVVFLFGALSAASLATAIRAGVLAAWAWWRKGRAQKAAEERFVEDIPTLTEHERRILAYLRHHKQRTFDATSDGGYANTLLAKRYCYQVAGAAHLDTERVPTVVADYVWRIINERPDEFPHRPQWSQDGGHRNRVETHPWRIPWHAR